jgi:hypothetical protein
MLLCVSGSRGDVAKSSRCRSEKADRPLVNGDLSVLLHISTIFSIIFHLHPTLLYQMFPTAVNRTTQPCHILAVSGHSNSFRYCGEQALRLEGLDVTEEMRATMEQKDLEIRYAHHLPLDASKTKSWVVFALSLQGRLNQSYSLGELPLTQ